MPSVYSEEEEAPPEEVVTEEEVVIVYEEEESIPTEEVPSEEEEVPVVVSEEEEVPVVPSEEEEVPAPSEEEVVVEEEEEETSRLCMVGEGTLKVVGHEDAVPLHSQEFYGDFSSYSFGFWFRWMSRYPQALYKGKVEEKYFMARMSQNVEEGDLGMGDRALALYLTRGGLHFSTYDSESNSGDVFETAPYKDIEGLWGYVYFSYSGAQKKAVGIVQFEGQQPEVVEINAVHLPAQFIKFKIGGSDNGVKSFQGEFASYQGVMGEQGVIRNLDQFEQLIKVCNPPPEDQCNERQTYQVVDQNKLTVDVKDFDGSSVQVHQLASEYAVGGWFKWVQPQDQSTWHSAFRLTINNQDNNHNKDVLGDRTLGVWVGNEMTQNILAFSTYTYTDLEGYVPLSTIGLDLATRTTGSQCRT